MNRAVLIGTQQINRSQSALFNSRTSQSGGGASNFTKYWRQSTKNVEIGSNTAGSSEFLKIPAKNQPKMVKELESQDLLVIFISYIEEPIGEGRQELAECIIIMVESVHGQYVEE